MATCVQYWKAANTPWLRERHLLRVVDAAPVLASALTSGMTLRLVKLVGLPRLPAAPPQGARAGLLPVQRAVIRAAGRGWAWRPTRRSRHKRQPLGRSQRVEWACRVDCGSLEDFTARFSGRERGTGGSFSCDSWSDPGEAVRCPLGYLDSERSG